MSSQAGDVESSLLSVADAETTSTWTKAGRDLRFHETVTYESFRKKLRNILHSRRFNEIVMVLILVDVFIVTTELFIILVLIHRAKSNGEVAERNSFVNVLHGVSLWILSLFGVEVFAKVYAFGCFGMFWNKLEIFDALVVVITLVIDVSLSRSNLVISVESNLLIAVRLLAISRILSQVEPLSEEEAMLSE